MHEIQGVPQPDSEKCMSLTDINMKTIIQNVWQKKYSSQRKIQILKYLSIIVNRSLLLSGKLGLFFLLFSFHVTGKHRRQKKTKDWLGLLALLDRKQIFGIV